MALRLAVGFDEGSGTTFTPAVGPGNGTITDTNNLLWVPGVHGSALGRQTTGPGAYTDVHYAWLNGLESLATSSWSAMTVMAWIFPYGEDVVSERWPMALYSSSSNIDSGWMAWGIPSGSSRTRSSFNGSLIESSGDAITQPTSWQHFCTTWDGTTQRFYVDGQLVVSGAVAAPIPETARISIASAFTNYGAQGVDDLRIYDEVLTAEQITALMDVAVGAEAGGGPSVNNLKVGSNSPTKLYLGNTEVKRAYLGDDLVYNQTSGTGSGAGDPVPNLYITPADGNFSTSGTVEFQIRADSQDIQVNTVQANISYPTSQLTFQSIDRTGSPFVTAIEETGGSGQVRLGVGILGGSTSGDQLVATIRFTAAAAGTANIEFLSDSGIADQATSSNICQAMTGAAYVIA